MVKIRNSITQIRENRTHGNDKIQWDEINWTEVYKLVNRLQTRIAKATQEKNIQRKLLFFSKNRTRRSQVSAFSPGLTFLGTACIRPADFVRQLRVCDALRNVPAGFTSMEPQSKGSGSTLPDGVAGCGAGSTVLL